jgi:hypothetical protein
VATPSAQRDTADVGLQVYLKEERAADVLYSFASSEDWTECFPACPLNRNDVHRVGVAFIFERHLVRPVGVPCDQLSVLPVTPQIEGVDTYTVSMSDACVCCHLQTSGHVVVAYITRVVDSCLRIMSRDKVRDGHTWP